MNSKIIFISVATLLAIFLAFSQYLNEFQSELVSAYDIAKPANGHSWDEMICTTGLCIKNDKVGIGTDNPAQKLSVAGVIESTSGGVKFPDGTTQSTAAGGSLSCIKISGCTTCPTGYTIVSCEMQYRPAGCGMSEAFPLAAVSSNGCVCNGYNCIYCGYSNGCSGVCCKIE